jgi:hypothetical protein
MCTPRIGCRDPARLRRAYLGSRSGMTTDEKTDPDEQFEKVKEGIGPDDKSSYAPAETEDDATERAEKVRREIREDRRRS